MKQLKNLNDLLNHEIQMLHNVEKYQLLGLERMKRKATDSQLKDAFEVHLEQTELQKHRLEVIANILEIDPAGAGNPSIKAMLLETEKIIHKDATPETLDAALIAASQKIEHYEIASYGTAAYLARELGLPRISELLTISLEEEKLTDRKLNRLAKTSVNMKAEVAYY
jgi:ferritin-like metal-binding protein YciE